MAIELNKLLNKQISVPKRDKLPVKQIPIEQVDELADELVEEYANPNFRAWYCGVILRYGVPKVHEWRRRASEGNEPGKLFTSYVNQAGGYQKSHE